MELLKVFVGPAAGSGATTVASMTEGDILLLDATTHAVADANSTSVVIAGKNSKGVYFSSPIVKANILYSNYKETVPASETYSTAAIAASPDLVASTTYSIGVQIKEDLRMGTYNKNTEIIASYTTPSSISGVSDATLKTEMASNIAKGFAANPLTSAGSPYQLVNVKRAVFSNSATGVTAAGSNLTVAKGSRTVTYGGTVSGSLGAGVLLNLGDSSYLVEKVDTTNKVITLDTAYQGTNTSVTSGTGSTAAAYFTATLIDSFTFRFDAVTQTQKNRYDQFRMVDFVVITPKGNDNNLITVTKTEPTYPVGSFRQVRDIEEKAHTNSMPLINYREFPFETFPLNADSSIDEYNIFTVTYNLAAGYNYMQSSSKEFPQTVVVCAPAAAAGDQFDAGTAGTFAYVYQAWSGIDVFPDLT